MNKNFYQELNIKGLPSFATEEEYNDFLDQVCAEQLSSGATSEKSCKRIIQLPVRLREKIILDSMKKTQEYQQLQATLNNLYSADYVARSFASDGKRKKILICSPHRNEEDLEWFRKNCLNVAVAPSGWDITAIEPIGLTVDLAKGAGIERAINEDYDYLFFWDDDVLPSNRIFLHDLLNNDVDVVCGVYYKKVDGLKNESACMMLDENGKATVVPRNLLVGITPAYICAGGFTLIKVEALKKLDFPYVKTVVINGNLQMNEDTYLTRKFEMAGIIPYIDTHVRPKHIDRKTGKVY